MNNIGTDGNKQMDVSTSRNNVEQGSKGMPTQTEMDDAFMEYEEPNLEYAITNKEVGENDTIKNPVRVQPPSILEDLSKKF